MLQCRETAKCSATAYVDELLQTVRARRYVSGQIRYNHCFGEILSSPHYSDYSAPFVVITHISSADERSNSSPVSGKIDSHVVNPSIRSNPLTTSIPIHRLGLIWSTNFHATCVNLSGSLDLSNSIQMNAFGHWYDI